MLDCDGVLIRSRGANLAYYNHLFGLFGLPSVPADDAPKVHLLHTLSTFQVIESFFPVALRAAAHAAASRVDYSAFLPFLEPEPGWADVLPRLRSSFPIVVATNRGGSALDVLGAVGILEHVDAVLTVLDVARPKPAPDLLLLGLARFGVSPAEALYVGDSELDGTASGAAEIPFVGFRYGSVSVETPWELESLLASPRVQASAAATA